MYKHTCMRLRTIQILICCLIFFRKSPQKYTYERMLLNKFVYDFFFVFYCSLKTLATVCGITTAFNFHGLRCTHFVNASKNICSDGKRTHRCVQEAIKNNLHFRFFLFSGKSKMHLNLMASYIAKVQLAKQQQICCHAYMPPYCRISINPQLFYYSEEIQFAFNLWDIKWNFPSMVIGFQKGFWYYYCLN